MRELRDRADEVVRAGEVTLFVAILVLFLPRGPARGAVMMVAGGFVSVVAALLTFNVRGFLDRYRESVLGGGYSGALAPFPRYVWRAAGFGALLVGAAILISGATEL